MKLLGLHVHHLIMEPFLPSHVLGEFAAFVLLCYCIYIYRTKRREVPTPSGALPVVGHLHLFRGQSSSLPRKFGAMADKYGPAFMLRLGVHPSLVVSSKELIKECFTTNDRAFATRPDFAAGKYLGFHYAVFGFSPYGPYWREMRKITTLQLLSTTRLNKLRHLRISEIDMSIKELFSLWAAEDNSARPLKVEMNQWFEHLTFNVITKMVAGKRYYGNNVDVRDEVDAQRFHKVISQMMYLTGVFVPSDAIPCCEWLDLGGHVGAMKSTAKEADSIVGDWLDEHRRRKMNKKLSSSSPNEEELDFIDVMLSIFSEDNPMFGYDRDTVIKAAALQLIAGASDSTSVTLTWALSVLLNNRQVLKRAQEELDAHVGRNRFVEESDIKNLVYLHAIVKEVLRLYPAAPIAMAHKAIEDCKVGGYVIPRGTNLLVNIWKLHRDPHVWSDPLEFKPERFLTTHAEVDVMGRNFEFIPFGSGIRSCPGITFAKQVVHLTLARLLQGFTMDTPSQQQVDMTEGSGITMPKATPLEVLLVPRLPPQLYQD